VREGVRARTEQVDVQIVAGRHHAPEGPAEVEHRLIDGLADTGHHLDGVAQQLLVHPFGPFESRLGAGEEVVRVVAQVAGTPVHQRELPLDADGVSGGGVEVDPHHASVPQALVPNLTLAYPDAVLGCAGSR